MTLLTLNNCEFGDPGLAALGHILPYTKLEEIDLSDVPF